MNIHEHQAKKILKDFGIAVPNGVVITDLKNIDKKIKKFNTEKLVLKAQIYSGGSREKNVAANSRVVTRMGNSVAKAGSAATKKGTRA